MQIYNLIEDNYSKTSGSLWQYYRDEPFSSNANVVDFPADNHSSASCKLKTKIAGKIGNNGR